jgi:hypothetical protein
MSVSCRPSCPLSDLNCGPRPRLNSRRPTYTSAAITTADMDHCDFDYTRCRGAQRPLDRHQPMRISRRQKHTIVTKSAFALFLVAAALPSTMAGTCISLQGSTACPAFTSASINTNLTGDLYVQPHVRLDRQLRGC